MGTKPVLAKQAPVSATFLLPSPGRVAARNAVAPSVSATKSQPAFATLWAAWISPRRCQTPYQQGSCPTFSTEEPPVKPVRVKLAHVKLQRYHQPNVSLPACFPEGYKKAAPEPAYRTAPASRACRRAMKHGWRCQRPTTTMFYIAAARPAATLPARADQNQNRKRCPMMNRMGICLFRLRSVV